MTFPEPGCILNPWRQLLGFFDEIQINVPCPRCGIKTPFTIRLLKTSPEVTCSGCEGTITIEASHVAEGFNEAQGALDRFKKALKN